MFTLLAGWALLQAASPEGAPQDPIGRLGTTSLRCDAPVQCAALSPAGGVLVVLDSRGWLTVWDVPSRKRRYSLPVVRVLPPGPRLACSPDGQWVTLTSSVLPASAAIVLDLASGREHLRVDRCFSPVYTPDGRTLVGSDGPSVRRWALRGGAELPSLEKADLDLKWVAVAPDGRRLAATVRGRSGWRMWDLETRKILQQPDPQEDLAGPEATALAFTPGGKLWSASFWGSFGLGGPPFFFANGGHWLVSGWRRKLLEIRALDNAEDPVFSISLPYNSPDFLEVSDSGDTLIRVLGAGIELERLPSPLGRPPAGVQGRAPALAAVAFISGTKAVTAEESGPVIQWDVPTAKELRRSPAPPWGIRSLSKDGHWGTLSNGPGDLRVWDLERGQEALQVEGVGRISSWALSEDGSRLAVGTAAGELSLWDVRERKERARLPGEVSVTAIAWSRGAASVAWGDALGGLAVAEGGSGKEPIRFRPRTAEILAIAFLPEGRRLVTGDRKGNLLLWADGLEAEPKSLGLEPAAVTALECAPDGRWLAVASGSHVRITPIDRKGDSQVLLGHQGRVTSLAFAPDGTLLLGGGEGTAATLWPVSKRE